jgi:hypothetical protein
MKDIAYTFTAFHALAAFALLGVMLFGAVRLVGRQRH